MDLNSMPSWLTEEIPLPEYELILNDTQEQIETEKVVSILKAKSKKKNEKKDKAIQASYVLTTEFVREFNQSVDLDENLQPIFALSGRRIDDPAMELNRLLEIKYAESDESKKMYSIVNPRMLVSEFNFQIEKKIEQKRKELIDKICIYKEDDEKNLEKLLTLIYPDESDETFVLSDKRMAGYLAIQNSISQVKLKMQNKKHFYPMVLTFCGPTHGTGKSTIVDRIVEPVKQFSEKISLAQLTDSRFFFLLESMMLQCDEMQGADRNDIERFKSIVTDDYSSHRILGTHRIKRVLHKSTIIGTSNKFSFETFKDTTGNRRLFDIDVMYKIEREALDTIDFRAIWDSAPINQTPSQICYLEKMYERYIKPIQNENKNEDTIEEFVREMKMEKGQKWVSYSQIDSAYMEYYKKQNQAVQFRRGVFHKKLKRQFLFKETLQSGKTGIWLTQEASDLLSSVAVSSL